MAFDLAYWLQPALDTLHAYGLFFLLGSFTVASLSDLRRMSAQSEFLHVWVLVAIALFALDVYQLQTGPFDLFAAKWGLAGILSLLCYRRTGLIFKLAIGDVCAIIAVCGLLSPVMVIIFFVLLKFIDFVLHPTILKRFGQGGAYPFMPVVAFATLASLPIDSFLRSLNLVF